MKLKESVKVFLSTILREFSYHPLIAPYLNTSLENPPQHYVHQYETIVRLALRKPIRVLIGDEIGLGKTITSIMIAKYLQRLGRIRRTLLVVPRVLVFQWHKELLRMGIPASKIRHIESTTLEFLKLQNFPEGYYIASMDLLKREERIGDVVDVPWDLIIVDEVHRFGYKTKRFWRIGKMLVEKFPQRNVIFLSATPHRGNPKDYILRLRLLDPYLIEGWRSLDSRQFYEATQGAILFRRTKEDINQIYEEREIFSPAKFYAAIIAAREDEAEFVRDLVSFLRSKLVEFAYEKNLISEKVIPLLTVLVFKRATSSPFAAWTTLERLLLRRATPDFSKELIDNVESFLGVGYEDYEYPNKDPEEVFNEFLDKASSLLSERDMAEVRKLRDMAASIMQIGDTKLSALTSLLEDIMAKEESKIIVFTEYKDTLDYLIKQLLNKHPEWASKILRLSSDETQNENIFQRIRNEFEKNPNARILIATDVVAEGVNLQVANILVNYEIPWSLIKIEQRIGRVWRLGQKKEVETYTLFMSNVADLAALNSMYEKLINLKKAELKPRPITGQEVLYFAEAEDLVKIPPSVAVVEKGKRRKFLRVTEARSILTFLREDQAGLNRLIASIVAAKREIERELTSKGVLYKPKTKREVEQTISLVGFKNPIELRVSMEYLVKSASKILGFKTLEDEGTLKVIKELEMPTTINTLDDIYGVLAEGCTENNPISLVSYGETEGTLVLVPVQIKDESILYSELVGVHLNSGKIFRGAELFNVISQALSKCLGIIEQNEHDVDIPIFSRVEIIEHIRNGPIQTLNTINQYVTRLRSLNMRDPDKTWIKFYEIKVDILKPVGLIQFVKAPNLALGVISEDVKKTIEEEAISFVMRIEKSEGRIPERMPSNEHYDIRSINPSTGETMLIEVKGHKGPEVYGELTDDEAELAKVEGERYWLYIVYDISSGDPKLLRFRDPLKTMNWKVFEKVERRYLLWPRNGVEEHG